MKEKGLCSNCVNDGHCVFQKDEPVLECEEHCVEEKEEKKLK